ncbi:MAG: di-heme oxidoredictase family protein, partial [Pseudomonadota bacterium]
MQDATKPIGRIVTGAVAVVALIVAFGATKPVSLPALGDPHLDVVPRTAAEAARIAAVTAPPASFDAPQGFEARSAGAATSFARLNTHAFSQASANMAFERELDFKVGHGLFKKLWVAAPASTRASDGLGPLYNARSCQRCHLKDGRGHPPAGPGDTAVSMVFALSVPGGTAGPIPGTHPDQPHPLYGSQLHDFSIPGVPAEGRIAVDWTEEVVALSGGETAVLRRPAWRIDDPAYGMPEPGLMLSPRVAP